MLYTLRDVTVDFRRVEGIWRNLVYLQKASVILVVCTAAAIAAPAQTFTTLFTFDGTDGSVPNGGLIRATDGDFYGTTSSGGAGGSGTVFKITPEGTLTTLYSFCSQTNCIDGKNPELGLIQATDGNFYGTTFSGGANGAGTVFKITLGGTLTTLHSFNSTDGANPLAGLVQATDGDLYGTTYGEGIARVRSSRSQ